MKQIKFRGYWIHGGSYIYGCGVKVDSTGTYIITNDLLNLEVDPDSVAQFIGYDCDDKEFYSDDIVIDHDGVECPFYILLFEYDEIGSKFINIKLKESKDETN